MNQVYKIVTDRIISEMENGRIPWIKTWSGVDPSNVISGKPYKGINKLMLGFASTQYGNGWFLTPKQANDLGGKIKNGEKASMGVFWKIYNSRIKSDIENDEIEQIEKRFVLRYYNLFNISQCENLKLPEHCNTTTTKLTTQKPNDIYRSYIQREQIVEGYGKPSYSPSQDIIRMPNIDQFTNENAFFATAFHETIHSTGHIKRLARFDIKNIAHFGSETYSKEELVAEIGSSFLCEYSGIANAMTEQNNIGYLQSWIQVLKNDPKMIIFAASKAEKATEYIIGATS